METTIWKLDNNGEIVITTDADDEREFLNAVWAPFMELALMEPCDQEHNLPQALARIVDIACHMRGYKNNVVSRSVRMSGSAWPQDEPTRFCIDKSGTPLTDNIGKNAAEDPS